jgi:hypothetical protein
MNSTRLTLSIVCVFVSAALFCGCNLFSQKANTEKRKYVTHREAIDSLQVANFFSIEDSSAALDTTLHGIAYTTLNDDTADAVLRNADWKNFFLSTESPSDYFGFFGEDRYKIEMWIGEFVVGDDNPRYAELSGKFKHKNFITNWTGKIEIDSVISFVDSSVRYSGLVGDAETNAQSYQAVGHFVLSETKGKKFSGVFSGHVVFDFYTNEDIKNLWYFSNDKTHYGGFLFDGAWTSYSDTTPKPFLLSADFMTFGNQILDNFSYGERDATINPKYKNLGWEEYWTGEEWWVEETSQNQQ